jgi:hypothetical protein
MHFDVEAESASQAATTGEAVATAALAHAGVRSAFAIHELTDPSGAVLHMGESTPEWPPMTPTYRPDPTG